MTDIEKLVEKVTNDTIISDDILLGMWETTKEEEDYINDFINDLEIEF